MPLCHLVLIFAKPINSCQINRQLSRCPFLSSYLNIWQETFCHTYHFCRNFPLSPKISHFLIIAICEDFPLCHLIWGFAKPLMDSCRIPHFLQFAIFVKIANCQKASFVVSFKFFAWPLKSRFCVMGFYCMPKVSVCCLKWDTTYSMCEYENINPTGINTSLQVNILAVILK